jgi:hypothetical protein
MANVKKTVEQYVTEHAGAELGSVFVAIAVAARGIERKIVWRIWHRQRAGRAAAEA